MYGAPAEQKIWKTEVTFLFLTSILLNRLSYIENVDRAGISWSSCGNVGAIIIIIGLGNANVFWILDKWNQSKYITLIQHDVLFQQQTGCCWIVSTEYN
jgi:hypothetical protein